MNLQFKVKELFVNSCESGIFFWFLTLPWRRSLSYGNQSNDLQRKSMDWFLYERDFRHERVKREMAFITWTPKVLHCQIYCSLICSLISFSPWSISSTMVHLTHFIYLSPTDSHLPYFATLILHRHSTLM